MNAIKILDAMTIGFRHEVDLKTVNIEMSESDVNEFLFSLSMHFEALQKDSRDPRVFIGKGQPFLYRGTRFRVSTHQKYS